MGTDFCPACRTSRAVTVQRTVREITDDDGNMQKIETESLHCEECGVFIKSEERPLDEVVVCSSAA